MDPITGRDTIKTFIAGFAGGAEQIDFRVRNIVADGDVVLTERVDVFLMPNGKVELPVMGTFEVQRRQDRRVARLLRHEAVHGPDDGRLTRHDLLGRDGTVGDRGDELGVVTLGLVRIRAGETADRLIEALALPDV